MDCFAPRRVASPAHVEGYYEHVRFERVNQAVGVKQCYSFGSHGVAWLLFVMAGMALWFGGGVIHAVVHAERLISEAEGIGLASLIGGFGALAKSIATRLKTGDSMISLSECVGRWNKPPKSL